jgi:hypothetical protein
MVEGGRAVAGFAAVAGAYGYVMSLIPRPEAPDVFWAGNLCAPWLVLAFLAGRAQKSWPWAVGAGALADVACFLGSYAQEATDTGSLGWYTANIQWLGAALLAGSLYGVLGCWWRRSRALVAGLAVAGGIVAEPAIWPVYDHVLGGGPVKGPWLFWAVEAAVGVAAAAWVVRAVRPRAADGSSAAI